MGAVVEVGLRRCCPEWWWPLCQWKSHGLPDVIQNSQQSTHTVTALWWTLRALYVRSADDTHGMKLQFASPLRLPRLLMFETGKFKTIWRYHSSRTVSKHWTSGSTQCHVLRGTHDLGNLWGSCKDRKLIQVAWGLSWEWLEIIRSVEFTCNRTAKLIHPTVPSAVQLPWLRFPLIFFSCMRPPSAKRLPTPCLGRFTTSYIEQIWSACRQNRSRASSTFDGAHITLSLPSLR
jgi:hypothetical protein